jgi:hypothetical protein
MRTRGAKNVRTNTDDLAYVRDPATELLLNHAATLTGEWGATEPPPTGPSTARHRA